MHLSDPLSRYLIGKENTLSLDSTRLAYLSRMILRGVLSRRVVGWVGGQVWWGGLGGPVFGRPVETIAIVSVS